MFVHSCLCKTSAWRNVQNWPEKSSTRFQINTMSLSSSTEPLPPPLNVRCCLICAEGNTRACKEGLLKVIPPTPLQLDTQMLVLVNGLHWWLAQGVSRWVRAPSWSHTTSMWMSKERWWRKKSVPSFEAVVACSNPKMAEKSALAGCSRKSKAWASRSMSWVSLKFP